MNIQEKEGVLSAEQINAILVGISEMTDNVDQQKYFLETIIEREFKDGAGGKTNDQLRAIARNEAERLLQQQVDEMKAAHQELKNSVGEMQQMFDAHKLETERQIQEKNEQIQQAHSEIETLKGHIENLKNDHNQEKEASASRESQKDETIQQLKAQLQTEVNRSQFNSRRRRRIAMEVLGVVILIALIVWFFCSSKDSPNWMGCFLTWVETLEDTQKVTARSALPFVFSLCLIPLGFKLVKDIFTTFEE